MTANRVASLVAVMVLASACTGGSSDDASAGEAAQTSESRDDYDFQLPGPNDEMVRVDAMGVALLSTVLANRDRTPSGDDAKNRYQIDSPDVQNNPGTLLSFVTFLHRLHVYWRDNLSQLGFAPCSKNILGVTIASPCTLQKLRFDEDANEEGPRVIDAVLPDVIRLDFDQPLRFPNGRTPWEPISDKIFALGFLEMGGKCPGVDTLPGVSDETKQRVPRDKDGVPICTIETFSDLPLQVAKNDRDFEPGFPYLAKPWFYAAAQPYYWPTSTRLDLPE